MKKILITLLMALPMMAAAQDNTWERIENTPAESTNPDAKYLVKDAVPEIDGKVCQVVEFQHVKPGKGAAFVRTKLRDIINGGVTETTFRPTDRYPQAHIEKSDMQYLYADGDMFHFMNVEDYEQIALSAEEVGDALKFVKENDMVKMLSYQGKVFSVEPPMFAELEITETEPGFKGDTATGASKPATVETGAMVMVPLFVERGDKIQIDTRSGEYLKRV